MKSPLKEIRIPSFLSEQKLLIAKLQEMQLSDHVSVGWLPFSSSNRHTWAYPRGAHNLSFLNRCGNR